MKCSIAAATPHRTEAVFTDVERPDHRRAPARRRWLGGAVFDLDAGLGVIPAVSAVRSLETVA